MAGYLGRSSPLERVRFIQGLFLDLYNLLQLHHEIRRVIHSARVSKLIDVAIS